MHKAIIRRMLLFTFKFILMVLTFQTAPSCLPPWLKWFTHKVLTAMHKITLKNGTRKTKQSRKMKKGKEEHTHTHIHTHTHTHAHTHIQQPHTMHLHTFKNQMHMSKHTLLLIISINREVMKTRRISTRHKLKYDRNRAKFLLIDTCCAINLKTLCACRYHMYTSFQTCLIWSKNVLGGYSFLIYCTFWSTSKYNLAILNIFFCLSNNEYRLIMYLNPKWEFSFKIKPKEQLIS